MCFAAPPKKYKEGLKMSGKTTDSQKFENQKGDTPPRYINKTSLAIVPKSAQESCPFRELIVEWLGCCRSDGLSVRTIADYQDKVFKFWWWWDKHYAAELGMHPKNVTTREARAFAAYLREPVAFRWGITKPTNNKFKQSQNLSAASIAGYGRAIKVFFNWLERENYIERSPFNKSVKFSNRNKQDRVIKSVAVEDINQIFATLTEPENL
jgi:site-specific recombinase XerD